MGQEILTRLHDRIDTLHSQNSVLLGFSITLFSFVAGLFGLFGRFGYVIDTLAIILFSISIATILSSLSLSLWIFWPSKYLEYAIFDDKIFDEITKFSEEQLMEDALFYYRKIYKENEDRYQKRLVIYRSAIGLFIVSGIMSLFTVLAIMV
jgi:hypothetical protein